MNHVQEESVTLPGSAPAVTRRAVEGALGIGDHQGLLSAVNELFETAVHDFDGDLVVALSPGCVRLTRSAWELIDPVRRAVIQALMPCSIEADWVVLRGAQPHARSRTQIYATSVGG